MMVAFQRTTVISMIVVAIALLTARQSSGETPPRETYEGYKLLRVHNVDASTAEWLARQEEEAFEVDEKTGRRRTLLDVMGEPAKGGPNKGRAELLVAPEYYQSLRRELHIRGVRQIKVLAADIAPRLEEQRRKRLESERRDRPRRAAHIPALRFNTNHYYTYDVATHWLRHLAAEHGDLVELHNVSRSFENRDILGVKITSPEGGSFKPAILVDAGVHAREWVAPAVALHMIKALVAGYKNGSEPIRRVLRKFHFWIVPQLNPDGYEYSMNTDRLWRKTRSRNVTTNKWCYGADANRNWGYRWGEAGANNSPCSNIYAGSAPFSEPEIQGFKEFLLWNIPQLTIYVSLHSYGQVLLSPWGYTNVRPWNYADQRRAAKKAVDAIKSTTNETYEYGTIAELMYPASGTSIDYMQDKDVPYIYGIELRPGDTDSRFAFSLPAEQIKPTGDEMLAALIAIADYAVATKKL